MNNFNRKLEYIIGGGDIFSDDRGKIENYKLNEKINLVATITSKPNTLRSNHYHPVQEQKCLLINGQYISVYKDLKKKNSIKITHLVNEGDLVITEPLVAHTMIFTKNSTFINLVNGEREHKNYGKTHTIPIELIKKKEKSFLYNNYKSSCRLCDGNTFKRVISLGFQPLANNFLRSKIKQDAYPLELNLCSRCKNVQLSIVPNFNKLFRNYLYKSSVSKKFSEHFVKASENYIKYFNLKPKKTFIIDIGSNDGIGLLPFKQKGFKKLLGIEPAKNLAKESRKKGIKTINQFFDKKVLKKINNKADLILASNVFAHADNLKEMAECMLQLLNKKGTIVIEVQYFPLMLKDLTFDNIYHEHVNYWSLTTLTSFFKNYKCKIFKAEVIDTHGGSIRIYVTKNINLNEDKSISKILKNEYRLGLNLDKTYDLFAHKVLEAKQNIIKNLNFLKKKFKTLIGYGAPAKSTTALNYFGITNDLISKIIDDNDLKSNRFVPGTEIKIVKRKFFKNKIGCVIVLAWNMTQEIKIKNMDLAKNFISIRDLYDKNFIKKFLSNKL